MTNQTARLLAPGLVIVINHAESSFEGYEWCINFFKVGPKLKFDRFPRFPRYINLINFVLKLNNIWGRVIYQRIKNRRQCNKALGFCFGTAIGFLVAASKTDVTSKTEYFQIKNRYHQFLALAIDRHRLALVFCIGFQHRLQIASVFGIGFVTSVYEVI